MKPKWLLTGLVLVLIALILTVITCTPTAEVCPEGETLRRKGCDQFKKWDPRVYKNGLEHTASDWYSLDDGDTLTTNRNGRAELNLSDCYPGAIFIFKDSGFNFHVEKCPQGGSGYCIPFGQLYVGACADEIDVVWTGSARIIKTSTTYAVTYLPDYLHVTLVVVLNGQVEVQPMREREGLVLGDPIVVSEADFVFTMPDDTLTDIGGFMPRESYDLTELPRVVYALGIEDWMWAVGDQAEQDDVQPEIWPEEFGGPPSQKPDETPPPDEGPVNGVVIMGGGPLEFPFAQEGMLRMVGWREVWLSGDWNLESAVGFIAEEPVDLLNDVPYDPQEGWSYLEEMGYEADQELTILYPAEDDRLDQVAELIAMYLNDADIKAELGAVPGSDLLMQYATMREAGIPVIAVYVE